MSRRGRQLKRPRIRAGGFYFSRGVAARSSALRAPISVVRKMGILEHSSNYQNCISGTNKIPEYAREFKNEYLFIRGINKEMDNFVVNYLSDCSELFVSRYHDRIKFFIKKILKAQELNYLKDTSCFKFKECDVENTRQEIWHSPSQKTLG